MGERSVGKLFLGKDLIFTAHKHCTPAPLPPQVQSGHGPSPQASFGARGLGFRDESGICLIVYVCVGGGGGGIE